MENLFERKSTLAKLLAQENLSVEHRNVPTAYFDLETRTIVLPNYREMDSDTYDLMTGHEVGHAFYTPAEGWHSAVENNRSLKSYLNVVEDARIERKIKEKYPGLRRSFNLAYRKLHEQDFFGLSGIDVKTLRLIDRINIFYKLGAHVTVGFSPDELKFVDRINAAQTWEDVHNIATDLHALAKEEWQKKKNEMKDKSPEDDESDEFDSWNNNGQYDEFEDSEESDDSDDSEDSDNFDNSYESEETDNSDNSDDSEESDEFKDSDEDEDEDEKESKLNSLGESETDDDDLTSITDNAFRMNEKNLIDGSIHSKTVFVPRFKPHTVVNYKKVHSAIKNHIEDFATHDTIYSYMNEYVPSVLIHNMRNVAYRDFISRSGPMVNYMVKEFEMRKNASQLSRAKVSKSGEVDVGKLSRYSLGADIFKRVTTIQQGKNHGLVLFIDLSGSMSDILLKTFEQAIALTMFCKKVNIPFDVYGFSNNPKSAVVYDDVRVALRKIVIEKDVLDLSDDCFHLKHYLSSSMNQNDYRESCMNLIYLGKAQNIDYTVRESAIPCSEQLHGTPLDEAVASSIEIVSNFKTSNRLDIVNCIFLTDGEGVTTRQYFSDNKGRKEYVHIDKNSKSSFYIQYPGTNVRVRYEDKMKSTYRYGDDRFISTRALIEVAKKVTGAKYTGYYICRKTDIPNLVYPYEFVDPRTNRNETDAQRDIFRQQMRNLRNKIAVDNFMSCDKFGFDEYFFVVNDSLEIKDEKIVVPEDATKSKLAKAFMASVKNRNIQRMFLSRFMQNIAA